MPTLGTLITTTFTVIVLAAASCSPGNAALEPAPSARVSPIEEAFGLPVGDAAEEEILALTTGAEHRVAECMLALGFMYEPLELPEMPSFEAGVEHDSFDYAQQYGFGITSGLELLATTGVTLAPDTATIGLSEQEAEEYYLALNGDFTSIDAAHEPGCREKAYTEAFAQFAVLDQFGDELTSMELAIENDGRLVEARQGWNRCMAEAGYTFDDPDNAIEAIVIQLDAITGPLGMTVTDAEALDALAQTEIAVATQTWKCGGDLRSTELRVRTEAETAFVTEHGDEIAAASQ